MRGLAAILLCTMLSSSLTVLSAAGQPVLATRVGGNPVIDVYDLNTGARTLLANIDARAHH